MTSTEMHAHDEYDLLSESFGRQAPAQWANLRESACPVAHSTLRGQSWLLSRYDDILAVAQDVERFSSRAIELTGEIPPEGAGLMLPPVTSDPPLHAKVRALVDPYFTVPRLALLEPAIRAEARQRALDIAQRGCGDVVQEYARPIALRALTSLLCVPFERQDRFIDWAERVIRYGPYDKALRAAAINEALADLAMLLDERTRHPGDDVVSGVAHATIDGEPVPRKVKLGILLLVVLGGADTTWSTMSSSLWHLAQHPEDRARLIAAPKLLQTTAVEELLRAFAPLSDARIAKVPVELHGRCIAPGDRVVLSFAAANRDPAVFDTPDEIDLERKRNRHLAFGSGPHRCLGSPLARLEMRIAISEWLQVMPHFELESLEPPPWTVGQVRGPASVRIRVTA